MTKLEKFNAIIEDLKIRDDNICSNIVAGSTVVYIYTNPLRDDFGLVYRQLAYYTSTWENVYITGIGIGAYITICFDNEVFAYE